MSGEPSSVGLDATLRDFSGGQKVFNRYTLIKTLGRGGMGIVWLAHDEVLDRDVALKFLPEIIVHDRAVLEDLKRETKRSLELTHKNIIRIHDFVHDVISGCISMEYVEGDTLSNLRADKPAKIFEPDELKPWLKQLCEALDYAHNHARIIHRDLKPSNLMINRRGDVKVADFGIARGLSDSVSMLTHARGTSGTLVYMSPQQLDGERGTHLDDIYSLGATIYELLTSRPPFYSGNIDRQIREKIPPPMAQRRKDLEIEGNPIPPNWEETVAACLAKNPAKRPQSVAEIANRLRLTSPRADADAKVGRFSKKKVAVGLAAAGTAIVFLAIILSVFVGRRQPSPQQAKHIEQAVPTISSAERDYNLALEYFGGMNKTQIDGAKAVEHLRRAAEQHLPEAEALLAVWTKYSAAGVYIPSSKGKAEQLAQQSLSDGLEKRANDGRAAAQQILGRLYLLGLGVPKDAGKAAELYQKAADQSYAPAEHDLGLLYQNGATGVSKDTAKAIDLQQKAADQGYADAQYTLGLLYKSGTTGLPMDFEKAAEMLQKAVDQGHSFAPTDLGVLYENGRGVPRDLNKAAGIYRKGAEKGNGPAREHLRRLEQAQSLAVAQETPREMPTATVAPSLANTGYNPAIAFVDMNRVFREYDKTKDAEAKINDAKSAAKRDYDDRANLYKKALDEINALNRRLDSRDLSADAKSGMARERDDKIANIKNMEREINEFRQTREKQLQDQALRMREGIVSEIREKIASLDNHLNNLIFDKSGNSLNGVPILMFTPDRADMSTKVVGVLNQNQSSPFLPTRSLGLGLVDMNRVFKAYNKTKTAEAKINEAKNAAKKNYDARAEAYKRALDDVNKLNKQIGAGGMAGAEMQRLTRERDDRISKVKNMEKETNDFRTSREKQLQDEASQMRTGIVAEITKVIGTGLRNVRDAVLIDASGNSLNGVPVAIYTKGVTDFSDQVIAALNENKNLPDFDRSLVSSAMLRFGTVNMNRAFKEWPDTKSAEAKINDAKAQAKKEYDERSDAYKRALDEINALNKELYAPGMNAEAKTQKAKERDDKIANIKKMEQGINEFRTTREKQLQEQALRMRENIVSKIKIAVNDCAETERLSLVFDSSGNSLNGVPIVLLSRDVPDLTDAVVALAQR